jgi:ATPase family protein associated with various cellular activities (AAA)/winged helix domain-containing protein
VSLDRDTLIAMLAPIRARLEGAATASVAPDPRSALALLVTTFGLTSFERDVLLLAAGCELDADFAAAVARVHGDRAQRLPNIALALAKLEGASWDAFAPDRVLRRLTLIELMPANAFTAAAYRVPERVLHALLGVETMDEPLRAFVQPLQHDPLLAAGHEAIAASLATSWATETAPWPLLMLVGGDSEAKLGIAERVASGLGLRAWSMSALLIPDAAAERDRLARMWERECALGGAVLVLVFDDGLEPSRRRAGIAWLERFRAAVIVCARDSVPLGCRAVRTAEVERPVREEQRVLWQRSLGKRAVAFNGQLDRVVGQFSLDAAAIARISATVKEADALWDEVRRDSRPALDDLAQRLPGAAGWTDLVLPAAQIRQLHDIVVQVRHQSRVYDEWGFGRMSRGLGVTALFSGPSGVGKTLAAEVLAHELRLDIYRIDLSQVVSKYIGETEKNLRRVFDAADGGGVVLLFDEADAIFGKRTEVNDSHDRYANIEVSYLLQRMETYRGLAVLTTNFKGAIDQAFMRRLRFIVNFPFPEVGERARIWQAVFPPELPREGLDFARLAQLNVPGGNIRGIALHASFIAAEDDAPVTMAHVMRAARAEYAKLDRTMSETELSGWR